MNYRPVIRAALICVIYFGLNLVAELLARSFSTGPAIGLCL